MLSSSTATGVARAAVAGVQSPRVAIVVRGDRAALVERLHEALPDATLVTLDASDGMDALHLALTAGRPWDLVLDVAAGKGAARRWPVLLHHVRRGGRLALRLPGEPGPVTESVAQVHEAQAAGAEPPTPGRDPRDNPDRDLAALAASVADLADRQRLVARNQPDGDARRRCPRRTPTPSCGRGRKPAGP